ncbi:hypothetical protein LOTGIDRAFT_194198, partial [Lottia gigantea]
MVVGHPLDTIKVQLQTQAAHNRYESLKACVESVKNQSLVSFYRGLSWPLLSYGAINSVYFGVYEKSLTWLTGHGICSKNSHVNMFIAGSMGGAAQLVIACPIDVIKVVLQSQIPHTKDEKLKKYYKGPVTAFRDILRVRGIAGLYRGIGAQLIRDIPSSGVYFFSFEYLRTHLSVFVSRDSKLVSLLAGGTAGVISWLSILPLDVVKSRLQADTERKLFTGFWNCAVKSYQEDGIRVFFRGGTMVSLRAFPVNAVIFLTY